LTPNIGFCTLKKGFHENAFFFTCLLPIFFPSFLGAQTTSRMFSTELDVDTQLNGVIYRRLGIGPAVGIGRVPEVTLDVNGNITQVQLVTVNVGSSQFGGQLTATPDAGNVVIDWGLTNKFRLEVKNTNLNVTFTDPPGPSVSRLTLLIDHQGTGAVTLADTRLRWTFGIPPVVPQVVGKRDLVQIYCVAGASTTTANRFSSASRYYSTFSGNFP